MNNSKLAVEQVSLSSETPVDIRPILREKEGELITILSAIQGVSETNEWSILKEKVFNGLTATLNREIQSEARKESPDVLKLNRLAGQLKWAEKYSDLSKLEQVFRTELSNIRKQLYGKTEENLG